MARNLIFLAVLLMALISFVAADDYSTSDSTISGSTGTATTVTETPTTTEHVHPVTDGSSTLQYSAMFLLVSAISAIISRIH